MVYIAKGTKSGKEMGKEYGKKGAKTIKIEMKIWLINI